MASKRELIAPNGDKRYIRRDADGRIRESDDQGRSLAQDQRRKAKTAAAPGQGDRGDRNPSGNSTQARNAPMKKSATKKSTATKKSAAKKSTVTKKSAAKKSAATKKSASATKKTTARRASGATARKSTAKKTAARRAASPVRTTASRGPNAIQLLKDDHKLVRGLLEQLEKSTPRGAKTRVELLARIAKEIEVHTRIEEEIFYPAFKAAGRKGDDDKMYFEALEEHRAAGDMVLPDLLATDPTSECFGGRAKVLKELVEHHAGEEEKEMFPRARALLSDAELKALGERMREHKAVLMADESIGRLPSPKSATAKIVEAVTGVFTGSNEANGASHRREARA